MKKEKININDIIMQAYADREMSEEAQAQLDLIAEESDKLLACLDEEHKKLFLKYELDVIELNSIYQEELVVFVLEFIKTFLGR